VLYGAYSKQPVTVDTTTNQPSIIQFLSPRPMQDGRTLAAGASRSPAPRRRRPGADRHTELRRQHRAGPPRLRMPGPARYAPCRPTCATIEGPSPGWSLTARRRRCSTAAIACWSAGRSAGCSKTRASCLARATAWRSRTEEAPPLYGI
jgi:hypothetical protein